MKYNVHPFVLFGTPILPRATLA